MDVAAYVKNVLSAYRSASSLVKRVQEKRSSPDAEAAQDELFSHLADSLALGPLVIDGQYKHELKRFGEAYACGDAHARDQMKDVLITLQMAVMSMQNVVLDDGPLDYPSLQSASDDSRVNAVVCLGQLSQRISAAVQTKAMLPHNGMPYSTGPEMMPMSPSMQYSSSRSTDTSGSTPLTPDYSSDRTAVNSFGYSEPKPLFAQRAPSAYSASTNGPSHRRVTNPRGDQHVSPPLLGATQLFASNSAKSRQPSSQTLPSEDTTFLIAEGQKPSPQSSQAAMSADTASLTSGKSRSLGQESPEMARGASRQTDGNRDRYRPDDFGDMAYSRGGLDDPKLNYSSLYENRESPSSGRHPSDPRPRKDTQSSDHSTLEHIAFLQSHARAPTMDDYTITSPLSVTQPSQPPPPPPLQHDRTPSPNTNLSNDLALPTRQRAPSTNSQDRKIHRAYHTTPSLDSGRNQDPPPTHSAQVTYQAKLQYYEAQRTRKPLPSRAERPSISAPIPVNPEGPPQPHSSTFKSLMPSLRRKAPHPPSDSTISAPAPGVHAVFPTPPLPTVNPPSLSIVPLNLPAESNTLNFCKGAFKLQAGLPKKAFTLANRPAGMTGILSFWQCSKCAFEGPVVMHTPPPPPNTTLKKPAKVEKIFDPRVRVCDGGGVRYKWVFLAKSHVSCKSVPEGEEARRGEFGAFACLFCCAEGRARGWDAVGGAGAPIFGNVGSFMEHLAEAHIREEGWPGVEMLGRGRAVVGRVAGPAEEWDVNFVPP